jgi:hypothetical protein
MTDQPATPTASPRPLPGALQVAPYYTNFFTVMATPNIVKISLGEAFGSAGRFGILKDEGFIPLVPKLQLLLGRRARLACGHRQTGGRL